MTFDQIFEIGFCISLVILFLVADYLQKRHHRRNQ